MRIFMTRFTKRNDIKPVFTGIAQSVMVLLSRSKDAVFEAAKAKARGGSREPSFFNSIKYHACCDLSCFCLWARVVLQPILCAMFAIIPVLLENAIAFPVLIGLAVSLFIFTTTLGFVPILASIPLAQFTRRIKTIYLLFIFVKFTNSLNFLALRASLCFNWFRHGFFLIKKLCSEPVAAHTAVGLFYNNTILKGVK